MATMRLSLPIRVLSAVIAAITVAGQGQHSSSSPHIYPGIPNKKNNFSDSLAWQRYFEVKDELPNVTFPLTQSFAGNLPVNRQGHPNNTLFFYGFSRTSTSLTSDNEDPWGIWLNGGPGSSSLIGLFLENGPLHFKPDMSMYSNPYSWHQVLDMFWIDQPVGVGYSTVDSDGYVKDEDQMAEDFFGFLTNLVQVFPSLKTRPLYLTGESYAGVYIPYITKAYFSLQNPPVNLRKIAIGDGAYASDETDILTAIVSALNTYPQIISYDTAVFKYFQEQAHLCRLDVNFTYPQSSLIPPVQPTVPLRSAGRTGFARQRLDALKRLARSSSEDVLANMEQPSNENTLPEWKRDLSQRPNGTIDPFYGCDLLSEAIDYALNFSEPWKGKTFEAFDFYDIPDATDPKAAPTLDAPSVFLNDPRVVAALHARDQGWQSQIQYPFASDDGSDPSPAPSITFSEFAQNLSEHGIRWVLYSGNADFLLPHRGTEIVIQNISFPGGTQRGFTRKPGTPWFDDEGNFAGIIHQEYNLTYALFNSAGHTVPEYVPAASLSFLKRFIIGDETLGSILPNGTVVGGERLAQDILPAVTEGIFFGSGATQGTQFYPTPTIVAWNKFTAAPNDGSRTRNNLPRLVDLLALCGTFILFRGIFPSTII